jgi:hypothetical protein
MKISPARGGYDFYNAGDAHQDNLFGLVLKELIPISNMAWGAPRHLLHEGNNTNFNEVEIRRLGSAFQRLESVRKLYNT